MIMSGFRSYDEAWQYAHALSEQTAIIRHLNKARAILISEQNLELLGTQFTYNEYEKFYQKHFASLKLKQNAAPLLTEPTEIVTEKKKIEETEAGDEEILDDKNDIDNSLEIIEDVAPSTSNESIEIKEENTQTGNNNGIEIKEDINTETPKKNNSEKETKVERNEDVFYFDDDTEKTQKQENKNQKSKEEKKDKDDKFDLEDEYFDFDGF
jgi:tetratricopeptide repeat protein